MSALDPILPGFYPDPSICRVGEDYYLVTSSFHYFPGVPIFHSRDMVNWTQIGHCLTRPEQLPLEGAKTSAGIYAPAIRWHDGVFYMITTNVSQQKHFIVTARDPAGEWSDPVWIDSPVVAANGSRGIDPSLFFEEDGTALFSWTTGVAGGNEMLQAPIDVGTGGLLAEPQKIWKGTGGQHTEAPHLYKIDGRYYLILAEGGTSYGHMVTIARSDTPWGLWEECPHNPILTHRSLDIPVQATGHGDLVETPDGDWWMVFLGVRPDMGHPRAYHLGRETFIAPVRWENGWPVVADNGRLTSETPLPAKRETDTEWSDDFTGTDFKSEWNFLRNPESVNYRLDGKGLRLCGTETLLDDAASPTWIGRRQQHLTCTFSAEMDWQVGGAGRAGLSVYMDEAHHYDLTITPDGEGGFQGEVRLRIGPLTQVVGSRKFAGSRACLAVKADPQTYTFGLIVDGEFEPLTTARVRYLTTEVAQGFTGVYFALFAEGIGVECTIRQVRYLL